MQDPQTAAAINAALCCDWATAITANTQILKLDPQDIDCLNRLGKAYLETGENKKAAYYFRRVLKIDKYDPIAQKNLSRATSTKIKKTGTITPAINFLEEPGKTKLVTLVNAAPTSVLLKQNCADALTLLAKRHTVVVEDQEGNYLGALPDDLGHRLGVLIKGGNAYEATIKSVSKNSIIVFLRETSRAKRFLHTPSFLASGSGDYLSFVREEAPTSAVTSEEDDEQHRDLHQDEEPDAT